MKENDPKEYSIGIGFGGRCHTPLLIALFDTKKYHWILCGMKKSIVSHDSLVDDEEPQRLPQGHFEVVFNLILSAKSGSFLFSLGDSFLFDPDPKRDT